ncbi:MAG: hypothetical protein IH598_13970 [Bacteroidales bacterium]|nr:hypothetical protein [Bacteroidales bacterium]
MKSLTFIISILLLHLAGNSQTKELKTSDFLWLMGTWQNTETGDYEHWVVDTINGKISGSAFSLSGSDTTFKEQMLIRKTADHYFFLADVPQNQQPVSFEIVATTENSFRSENTKHDFPTFISYSLVSEVNLVAEIGNQYRSMRFEFVRIEEKIKCEE